MNPVYIDLYIAFACSWLCIETNISLKKLNEDKQHWLNRAMTKTRRYAKGQGPTLSVGIRIAACFGLTFAAWMPLLLTSLLWPVTVPIYVIENIRKG
ncbi:hypothetical protein E0G74_01250 [Salmonella enterica]|nr:hypothetical protein [Salmonella enterica]ECB1886164.1 hypothetical protein [Salmonella enterica subsp. enterica serovar Mississippi]